jgi:hypothetical protein
VAHKKAAGPVTAGADYETRICATGKQHKSNKLKSHAPQATRGDLIGCVAQRAPAPAHSNSIWNERLAAALAPAFYPAAKTKGNTQ